MDAGKDRIIIFLWIYPTYITKGMPADSMTSTAGYLMYGKNKNSIRQKKLTSLDNVRPHYTIHRKIYLFSLL